MIRTVIEVAGHTPFKPFPKSATGRRTVPIPSGLVLVIREHRRCWSAQREELIFANKVGASLRWTLFRPRIWRPSLVRVGLLAAVVSVPGGFEARWADDAGVSHVEWSSGRPRLCSTSRGTRLVGCVSMICGTRTPRDCSSTTGFRGTWCNGHGARALIDNAGSLHPADRQQ